jgi:hypothetical protein
MALALVTDLEAKIREFLAERAPEIEHAGQVVDAVAGNSAVQALLAAAHIPPSVVQMFADVITRLDAEFAAKAADHAQAVMDAHAQGAAEAAAAAAEPDQQAS